MSWNLVTLSLRWKLNKDALLEAQKLVLKEAAGDENKDKKLKKSKPRKSEKRI